jgi:hypothetical protein
MKFVGQGGAPMRARIVAVGVLVAGVYAGVAGAQQTAPSSEAPAAAQPIQIAQTFLIAWGHER